MSYTPKHGGQNKGVLYTGAADNNKPAEPSKNKKKSKALVISLLVLFSAGIIVALIFLLKPVFAPSEAVVDETVAVTSPATYAQTPTASDYSGSYTSSNPVLQYSGGEVPTSGERHDVTVIADGGVNAMEIIGTWRVDEWTAYVFDGYGRGVMLTTNENYTFAYSAQNGQLIIDYDNDKGMDTEYTYILNGDNLTLLRGNSEYKLTKDPEKTEE